MEGVVMGLFLMGLSRRKTLQLTAAAALAPFSQSALADAYPSRVVRLFVGFPPGGGADLATRIIGTAYRSFGTSRLLSRTDQEPGSG